MRVLELLLREDEAEEALVSAIELRNENAALLNECLPDEAHKSCCARGVRQLEARNLCETLKNEIDFLRSEIFPAFERVPNDRVLEYLAHTI